jgi:hypothetical protein
MGSLTLQILQDPVCCCPRSAFDGFPNPKSNPGVGIPRATEGDWGSAPSSSISGLSAAQSHITWKSASTVSPQTQPVSRVEQAPAMREGEGGYLREAGSAGTMCTSVTCSSSSSSSSASASPPLGRSGTTPSTPSTCM